jgi:hypothetical protein
MTPMPTPGQIAYEAYVAFWCMQGLSEQSLFLWGHMTPEMHRAWEAAAQAVLAIQAQENADA